MPGKKLAQGRAKKRLLAKELNENTWKSVRDLGRKANSALELAIIAGLPIRAIAREFHMSPAGVRYHRQRLQRGPPLREPINTPEGNIGPKVSKEQLKTIRARRRLVRTFAIEKVASTGRKKYTSVAKIAAALQFNKGIVVGRTTVYEDLLAMGYSSKARRKQPVLTAEKMLKRVRFARCPPSGAVLFSDECYCGSTVEGKNEWVTEDEEPAPQEQDRFELKIMVFGIIGKGISRFKVYPAKTYINAAKYKECLEETLLPIMKGRRSSHVFMQDNASAHTAAETVDFLSRHHIPVLDWPPTSPDLNENLWAYIKHKMGYFPPILNKNKANVEKMRAHIQKTIDSIPQDMIDNFVDSFPYRLEACTLLGGKYVHHKAGRKLIAELKERDRLAKEQ
jgi:hypothetical protein